MAIEELPQWEGPAPQRGAMSDEAFRALADLFADWWITLVAALPGWAASVMAEAASVISGVASVNTKTGVLTGFTENTAVQTLTHKTLVSPVFEGTPIEDIFPIVDGAAVDIDPANGSTQVWTLGANRTPTAVNFASGQSITLYLADGASYIANFATMGVIWDGGVPVLPTSGYARIVFNKVGANLYGKYAGAVA